MFDRDLGECSFLTNFLISSKRIRLDSNNKNIFSFQKCKYAVYYTWEKTLRCWICIDDVHEVPYIATWALLRKREIHSFALTV